jgi:hypothetical protein
MTTYFEHVSRGTSWELLTIPPAIEVTETELTDEEIAEWTMKLAALSVERSAASLPG